MPAGECIAVTEIGTVLVLRAKKTDRRKLLSWDGTGLAPLRACLQAAAGHCRTSKRLQEHRFTWPAVKDGLMLLNHALFAGLDWRGVCALEARAPEAVE